MKKLKKIMNVISAPESGLQQVTQEAHFLIMACCVVISKIILLVARYDLFREYCERQTHLYMSHMNELYNLNLAAVQIEKMVAEAPYKSLRSTLFSSIAMYFLAGIFIWMLVKIRKGDGNLKQYLSIMAYAQIPIVLSYLFLGLVSIGTNELYFNSAFTSIGYYLPSTVSPFFKGILSAVELFAVWKYILVYYGLKSVTGFKKRENIMLCLFMFGILMLISGLNVWAGEGVASL